MFLWLNEIVEQVLQSFDRIKECNKDCSFFAAGWHHWTLWTMLVWNKFKIFFYKFVLLCAIKYLILTVLIVNL